MEKRVKKRRIKRKRIKRLRLLKPIEVYALLITAIAVLLSIMLFEHSHDYREGLKAKAKKAIYDQVLEIAAEEKDRYNQLKKEGKSHEFYDKLSPEQKEMLKKEYESLKKMNN